MKKKKQLIKHMTYALESHLEWARTQERLARAGKLCIKHVGSATFHRRWVHIYKEVIEMLSE